MKKIIITLLGTLTFLSSASATIQTKVYKGEDLEGHACEIDVKSVTFLNQVKHPLNERVEVLLEGTTFVLRHPETVNTTTGAVQFDHDVLQGVLALPTGARSLTIVLNHVQGKTNALRFIATEDNWKTKNQSRFTCHLQ